MHVHLPVVGYKRMVYSRVQALASDLTDTIVLYLIILI